MGSLSLRSGAHFGQHSKRLSVGTTIIQTLMLRMRQHKVTRSQGDLSLHRCSLVDAFFQPQGEWIVRSVQVSGVLTDRDIHSGDMANSHNTAVEF